MEKNFPLAYPLKSVQISLPSVKVHITRLCMNLIYLYVYWYSFVCNSFFSCQNKETKPKKPVKCLLKVNFSFKKSWNFLASSHNWNPWFISVPDSLSYGTWLSRSVLLDLGCITVMFLFPQSTPNPLHLVEADQNKSVFINKHYNYYYSL